MVKALVRFLVVLFALSSLMATTGCVVNSENEWKDAHAGLGNYLYKDAPYIGP